jgi:PAS domain S-box-containing protein
MPLSSTAGAQALLSRLADSVPSMLAYWDSQLRCGFANQAYLRWFGVEPEALMGTRMQDLLGADLFALNEPYVLGALRGEPQTFERVVPGPGGARRHSLANYIPDIVGGEVRGFFVEVTETTRIKQAESELRDSELRFRTLSEASPFGIYQATSDGQFLYTNTRWQEITGIGGGRCIGFGWYQAVHADDRAAVLSAWREAAAAGGDVDMVFRVVRPDGEVRIVHSRARPFPSGNPSGPGYVGALDDITELRLADQRLRASESFLDRAGRIAGVGGWELDLNSKTLAMSDRTRRIHELDEGVALTLEQAIQFYAPQAQPIISAAVQQALANGTPWDLELPFITAKDRVIWVRTFGEVEWAQGQPVRLVGAFQDVTDLRQRRGELQRERALRQEMERHAQETGRLLHERSEMLDVLAHEVRQPLNNASAALQSASNVVAEVGASTASVRLTRAQVVMGQVLASIDNTLAVATLLARPEPLQQQDTDIDTLLAVAIADMPAGDRGRIQIDRATQTRTATMDMSLMRLALRNLLSNALKYGTPGSPVRLQVSDCDDPLALVLEVTNTGSGIAPDLLPRLFERGARGVSDRGLAGHGLGLYIVRRVMELHGGKAELIHNTAQRTTLRLVVVQAAGD